MGHPSTAPTTFVQADTATFKELVQKLTGATTGDSPDKTPAPLSSPRNHSNSVSPKTNVESTGVRRSPFKLQERRQHALRKLEVKLGLGLIRDSVSLPNSPRCLSVTSTPVQSPVTPLGRDTAFSSRVGSETPPSEEEKAIAQKGFYLHPSPRKPQPPELLTLFPMTSPRQAPWAS